MNSELNNNEVMGKKWLKNYSRVEKAGIYCGIGSILSLIIVLIIYYFNYDKLIDEIANVISYGHSGSSGPIILGGFDKFLASLIVLPFKIIDLIRIYFMFLIPLTLLILSLIFLRKRIFGFFSSKGFTRLKLVNVLKIVAILCFLIFIIWFLNRG